jgi:hypothetical protein
VRTRLRLGARAPLPTTVCCNARSYERLKRGGAHESDLSIESINSRAAPTRRKQERILEPEPAVLPRKGRRQPSARADSDSGN